MSTWAALTRSGDANGREHSEAEGGSEICNDRVATYTSAWPRNGGLPILVCLCGLVILAGGLGLAAPSLHALSMPNSDSKSALQQQRDLRSSSGRSVLTQHRHLNPENLTCILHVSYGEKYMRHVDKFTVPNKRMYANRHGYKLKLFQRPSMEELFSKDFAGCGISNESIHSKHRNDHALLKFCGVQAAFDDGCGLVVWTDSDAAFVSFDSTVDSWFGADPNNREPDVFWSVSGPHEFCNMPTHLGCKDNVHFEKCVNSGLFMIRNTEWSQTYVRRVLGRAVSMVPAKNWDMYHPRGSCNLAPYMPPSWSQCYAQEPARLKYGDQCVIACDSHQNSGTLDHFGCTASHHFQLVQIFEHHHSSNGIPDHAYLVNCAGHDEQIQNCFQGIGKAQKKSM
jgi:hypothetical protein